MHLQNLPGAGAAAVSAAGEAASASDSYGLMMFLLIFMAVGLVALGTLAGILYGRVTATQQMPPGVGAVRPPPGMRTRQEPADTSGDSEREGVRRRRQPPAPTESAAGSAASGKKEAEGCGPAPYGKPRGCAGFMPASHGESGTEVRTVQTQSQTVYKHWCRTPRFVPYCGSADGTPGFFTVGRLEHDAGDE